MPEAFSSDRSVIFLIILFFAIAAISMLFSYKRSRQRRRMPSPLLTDPAAGIERRSQTKVPYPTYGGASGGLDPHPGQAPEFEPDGGIAAPGLLKTIADHGAGPSYVDPASFAAIPAGDRAGVTPRDNTGD